MKKLSTLLCSLVLSSAAFAQIPNASFESWTAHTGYNTPDDWGNLNPATTLTGTYTCEKGVGGATGSGSNFIKLTSKAITVPVAATIPGIAVTGTINTTTFTVSGGFPYNLRPAGLSGQWQYMAMSGSDAAHIAVFLSRWNTATNKRDTVAFTDSVLGGMAMSWAPFTINLNYHSDKFPDTAMIVLSSSGVTPAAGSYLWVDGLSFTGSVPSAVPTVENGALTAIYPNPAHGNTTITYSSATAGAIRINITDVNGRTVAEINSTAVRGENTLPVSVSAFTRGIYFVRITGGNGTEVKKLIVE